MKLKKLNCHFKTQIGKLCAFYLLLFSLFCKCQITLSEGAKVFGDTLIIYKEEKIENHYIVKDYIHIFDEALICGLENVYTHKDDFEKVSVYTKSNKKIYNDSSFFKKKIFSINPKKELVVYHKPEKILYACYPSDYIFCLTRQKSNVFFISYNHHVLKVILSEYKKFDACFDNTHDNNIYYLKKRNQKRFFEKKRSRAPPYFSI